MQRPFMMGQVPPQMMMGGMNQMGAPNNMHAPNNNMHGPNPMAGMGNFNMMPGMNPNQNQMSGMMANHGNQMPGMGGMMGGMNRGMNPMMMGTNQNMMMQQQQQQQNMGMMSSQQMQMANMMAGMNRMPGQNVGLGMNMMHQGQSMRGMGPACNVSQQSMNPGASGSMMHSSNNFQGRHQQFGQNKQSSSTDCFQSPNLSSISSRSNMSNDRNRSTQISSTLSKGEGRFSRRSDHSKSPDRNRQSSNYRSNRFDRRNYDKPRSYDDDRRSSRSDSTSRRSDFSDQENRSSKNNESDSERKSSSRKRSYFDSDTNQTSDTDTDSRDKRGSGSDRSSQHRSRSPRRYKKPSFSRDGRRDRDDKQDGQSSYRSYRNERESRTRDRTDNFKPDTSDAKDYLRESTSRNFDDEPEESCNIEPENVEPSWIRCSPADLYFTNNHVTGCIEGTKKMKDLEDLFERELVQRSAAAIAKQTETIPPPCSNRQHHHHHHSHCQESSDSDSDDSSSSSDSDEEVNARMEELERKRKHPHLLHPELWYNEPGQVNDGPLCRCSLKSQQTGIRHNIYPGEEEITTCDMGSNNKDKLFHYRVAMSPPTNFLTKCPTIIEFDNHEYIFEGFSIFSHYQLEKMPICRVIRFNIEYTIHFIQEPIPENYTVRSLDLFTQYLFNEILELMDIDWRGPGSKSTSACHIMHLMPRFSRSLPENGKEVLSMNEVLSFLIKSSKLLIDPVKLPRLLELDVSDWQNFIDAHRGMIVFYPGKRPCALRIDQLDRKQENPDVQTFPLIIHFGSRPAQLSYVGDPAYQRLWKQYIKFRHLLSSKPKVSASDKIKLNLKEQALQELRTKSTMKREVTVEISSEGFICTGLKADISQHAMLIPVLLGHLRFHKCLYVLEKEINYKFKDRYLLQLALTHTSYRVNYGTNPDHARNSLANAGRRQVEYGSRKVLMQNTRKRGLNILIDIMSRMGKGEETLSEIPHNERLEFLGDAVVEFLSSVHLFYMFPWLEEGGLSTYRTAIVQNQHLAILAKKLRLQEFMMYAHGPDLCHEYDLRHAMANCFEALMGALFIDGGIELADRIFGETLFGDDAELLATWRDVPHHPLQEDQPDGDRQWIESSHILQKLLKFEESIGVEFDHIRLLARAFTPRNVGYTNLTLGHNQRLEFLGDTVLQLIASEYLFKHFPEHHEGHLTLLRSSLVNNRTQSIVCDDLGMTEYVIYDRHIRDKGLLKTKEKADLLEAFIGAFYVDKDLDYCRVFCDVCFFPRLQDFILNQDWNDPKSQLQQCCLTLRELDGGEPDIPVYKVIESKGPTNTRMYVVAVYFRGERLATGQGHSIQQAEMSAATNAMNVRQELFPIIIHQKRFLESRHRNFSRLKDGRGDSSSESSPSSRKRSRSRSSVRRK